VQLTAVPSPTATSAPLPTPISGTGQAVHLIADGVTETYALISGILGGNPIEIPNCAHPEFGPHITQEWDDGLGKHSYGIQTPLCLTLVLFLIISLEGGDRDLAVLEDKEVLTYYMKLLFRLKMCLTEKEWILIYKKM
jgi:hypothetical protein